MDRVLEGVLAKIAGMRAARSDEVLLAWPSIVGERLAPMTRALSFEGGTFVVEVKNSTLYSLLVQKERGRLLGVLQRRFPTVQIRSLQFRMG
jgi:hypothetical protein